jgi:hypothetical protein
MKTTITRDDFDKAIKESSRKDVCCCCLVFQAAKRIGLDPSSCGYYDIILKDGRRVVFSDAVDITMSARGEWLGFVGREIEFLNV